MSDLIKFEGCAPSSQTAVDVFRDRWASDLGQLLGVDGTEPYPLFTHDPRPQLAADALGRGGRFDGMTMLEIGPLEAAHTRSLGKLGATSIIAVEASAEAWLKCLVVKELLGLTKSTFLLGDAVGYLEQEPRKFDAVLCSGVLYHMSDPLRLIRAIAASTDRCFVWTHVYDADRHPVPFTSSTVKAGDTEVAYWSHQYGAKDNFFWGGNDATAVWMTKPDMIRAFEAFGMHVSILDDQPDHPNGPSLTFVAQRS